MIVRLAFLVFIMVPFCLIGIPVQVAIIALRLPYWHVLPRLFHRMVAKFLGLRVTVVGRPYDKAPTLLLSNHISWLDIPAIGAHADVAFVARADIASWPLVGFMAMLQKTIRVNRERRTDAGPTGQRMAAHLARGDAVLLFAEGTSDIGTHVLPFRSALVGSVEQGMVRAGIDQMAVQPMVIAYTDLQGMPIGRSERSMIAWVGDMGLWDNFFDILRAGSKAVTVMFGEPILVRRDTNRKAVTRLAEIKAREMLVAINRRASLPPAYEGTG